MTVRTWTAAAMLAVLALAGCDRIRPQPPIDPRPTPVVATYTTTMTRVCRQNTVDGPYIIRASVGARYARSLTCRRIAAVVHAYLSSPSSAGGAPAHVGIWRCVFNPPGVCTSKEGRLTFVHA
jgi:hypothetical protein